MVRKIRWLNLLLNLLGIQRMGEANQLKNQNIGRTGTLSLGVVKKKGLSITKSLFASQKL